MLRRTAVRAASTAASVCRATGRDGVAYRERVPWPSAWRHLSETSRGGAGFLPGGECINGVTTLHRHVGSLLGAGGLAVHQQHRSATSGTKKGHRLKNGKQSKEPNIWGASAKQKAFKEKHDQLDRLCLDAYRASRERKLHGATGSSEASGGFLQRRSANTQAEVDPQDVAWAQEAANLIIHLATESPDESHHGQKSHANVERSELKSMRAALRSLYEMLRTINALPKAEAMACVGQWVRALEEVFPEGVPLSAFELFLECAVRPCDSPAMGTHFLQALYTVEAFRVRDADFVKTNARPREVSNYYRSHRFMLAFELATQLQADQHSPLAQQLRQRVVLPRADPHDASVPMTSPELMLHSHVAHKAKSSGAVEWCTAGAALYGPLQSGVPGECNEVTLRGPRGDARASVVAHKDGFAFLKFEKSKAMLRELFDGVENQVVCHVGSPFHQHERMTTALRWFTSASTPPFPMQQLLLPGGQLLEKHAERHASDWSLGGEKLFFFKPLERGAAGEARRVGWAEENAYRRKLTTMYNALNESQRTALRFTLDTEAPHVGLLQGPPGTGKTHTAVEVVAFLLRDMVNTKDEEYATNPHREHDKIKDQILVTAFSNTAVDLLGERLAERRIGAHIVRIRSSSNGASKDDMNQSKNDRLSLEYQVQQHKQAPAMQKALREGDMKEYKQLDFHIRRNIVRQADVILATCMVANSELLADRKFTRVLMDEASQATEPAMLCAINRHCETLIMVGDHKQLPPTLKSDIVYTLGHSGGGSSKLNQSLFERLVMQQMPYRMLDTQYRMHPAIAEFPSMRVYDGKLLTGITAEHRPVPRGFPWPDPAVPVCFLDIDGQETASRQGGSARNRAQAAVLVDTVESLLGSRAVAATELAVITPYMGQKAEILGMMRKRGLMGVSVDTVDSYQGMERDIVMVSTVRSNSAGAVGFLKDERRFNVMMTRARRGLIVLGDSHTLRRSPLWAQWLAWVRERKLDIYLPPEALEASLMDKAELDRLHPNVSVEEEGTDEGTLLEETEEETVTEVEVEVQYVPLAVAVDAAPAVKAARQR